MTTRRLLLVSAGLADPTRYRVLELIALNGTLTNQGLIKELRLSAATISHHLRELRLASLVESTREGQWRHYKVKRQTLDQYVATLTSLGQR